MKLEEKKMRQGTKLEQSTACLSSLRACKSRLIRSIVQWTKGNRQIDENIEIPSLPRDIIELIIAILIKQCSMKDAIRYSIVCKDWLYIASIRAHVEPPWLTISEKTLPPFSKNKYISCLNLWGNEASLKQAVYRLPGSPKAMARSPCGVRKYILATSLDGWLLIGCDCHYCCWPPFLTPPFDKHPLSLYNPFVKICFDVLAYSPPNPTCCRYQCAAFKAMSVFRYNIYPDYYFVVLAGSSNNLSLCRLDGLGQWSYYHHRHHSTYCDLLFRLEEQCLYASDYKGRVDVFRIIKCDNKENDGGSIQDFRLNVVSSVQIKVSVANALLFSTHLVEFCGHVVVVTGVDVWPRKTHTAELYMLANKGMRVSRIHSFGDHALFLAMSGSAAYCVLANKSSKVQRNCIYYHVYDQYKHIIMSLEDGAINTTYYSELRLYEHRLRLIDPRFIAPPRTPLKPAPSC